MDIITYPVCEFSILEYKCLVENYPFCFAYDFDLHDKIESWLIKNNIEHMFYMDGDDHYSHSSVDTVSFKTEKNAIEFKLKWL